ncbi:UV DNA damage repair endonuclease UvsE [Halobacillus salinarum]|uniref:UV DNA damage endonuclease n=1 Tax=Halobacillus salinarum TaxID=2932257 RepID=A0ABY4EJ57_9BACI|nr:UV DNA damage repair endonuclease UvsE [Halobacillus salinarum]UOQ44515.1 UV DNA damage repair endonuclease UvsE [Halobacillus salinarum]
MKIRIGYVAHALSLFEATPAKTITFTRYQKLDVSSRENELQRITKANLEHTKRALHYNIAHEIEVYRFSSSLIPLATHKEVEWDYLTPFKKEYEEIGELVRGHNMRTSFHPNQFTLFTSDKPHVTANAIEDMDYHYALLKAMGLEKETHLNLHVGGAYGNKQAAIERFHTNIKKLPLPIKKQLTLENDDKTYTTEETLGVCEKESVPMMFDYHHFVANHSEEETLRELLPRFFETWKGNPFPPKIHISSPRTLQHFRRHADYIDLSFIKPLISELKALNQDVDFMIEAKEKDKALLKFAADFAGLREVNRISGAAVEL